MRRRLLAALPLSALVLLGGCGVGGTAEAAGSATTADTAGTAAAGTGPAGTDAGTGPDTATGTDTAAGPDPASAPTDTSPVTGPATAGEGPTVVTAVRVGDQDGFDRVVLEVSGTAVPGWDVAYVDAPAAEGTGSALDVPGTAFLRVTLTGTTNPYEAPEVTEAPRGLTAGPGAGAVQGVFFDSTYEGRATAWVGVSAERPFRVHTLDSPTRVVVDITD